MGRTKTPAERFAPMPADKHGVRSGYTYWGCRCDACTRADLAYRRPITERGPIPDTAHATRAGYRYWGCRCDACILANRTAAHHRRDARRGPAPEGPTVTRRYRYRIDTTPAVRAALMRVFGGCRFIHNAYIAMARDAFAGGNAHPTLGEVTKALITQGRANPDTPWLRELPTIALRGALKDAVQAYENFFSSVTGTRQGRSIGRPVFQRRHARQTARFYEAGFRIRGGWQNTKRGGGRLYLSKVGTVSVNWHRPLPSHPSSVTIIKAADGTWWASFVVSVPVPAPIAPTHPDRVAGIDLGLTDLATIAYSDGTREKIAAPKHYRAAERKLARAQKSSLAHNAEVRTGRSCASRWCASTPAPPICDATTPANSSPD